MNGWPWLAMLLGLDFVTTSCLTNGYSCIGVLGLDGALRIRNTLLAVEWTAGRVMAVSDLEV